MIDFEAELDRLAADLAVLDVACGARTRVNRRLGALAAIRALDQVKLHAAWAAASVRRYAGIDYQEVNRPQLLEHLEFEDSEYFAAFEIPRDRNGRKVTGPNEIGRAHV